MIDFSPKHLEMVQSIVSEYVPEFEVWAFGPRVDGKSKPYSDLDLAIITEKPLPVRRMALLKDALTESDLPFKVDVVDWSTISVSFREVVRRNYTIITPGSVVQSSKT